MNISEIYKNFDRIGCCTFATVDNNIPQTRIAHLFAFDDEGLYFRTMTVKAFYDQLKKNPRVSICGMFPKTTTGCDAEGLPYIEPGYTIRVTGDVKEISLDTLKEKAAGNDMFTLGVKDTERYPAMTTFCLYRGWGEVFDFDFEMEHRPHKLLRADFCFGGARVPFRGVRITDKCTSCGKCKDKCSFKAIYEKDGKYVIDHAKCDVCGDCCVICQEEAVEIILEDINFYNSEIF